MRLHVRGHKISSVDDWFRLAPPKGGADQWREYRSAMELARAWCPSPGAVAMPSEVAALLESHHLTAGLVSDGAEGTPELRVRFDGFAGEPRNTDLAFSYRAQGDPARVVAVSVEAKADEALGPRVSAAIRAAERRRAAGKPSNGDRRARELIAALFGPEAVSDPAVGGLRYQLLTATAGALAFAAERGASVAVLVVHEFVDGGARHTSAAKLAANARDIDAFVARLSGGVVAGLPEGALAGPFAVPGNEHLPGRLPLLIGKIRRVLA